MMLTVHQLHTLRHDLTSLATIEYDDVMAELLDHYASLTEQKMASGITFDEASKWAWAELGSCAGLQKIQDDYEKSIERQVRAQHFAIIKNYFRWPMVVTTALVATIVYLIAPVLSSKWLFLSIYGTAFSPAILLIWGYSLKISKQISTGKIVWKYMRERGLLVLNFLNIGTNLPRLFLDDYVQTSRIVFQDYTPVLAFIAFLTLLYTTSFI